MVPFDPEWDYSLIKTITDEFYLIGWQQKIDDEFLYVPGEDKNGNGCVKRFELAHHNLNMTYEGHVQSEHNHWYNGVAVGDDVVLATEYSGISGSISLFNKNGSLLQQISDKNHPYQIATDGDQVFLSRFDFISQQFYSLNDSHTAMEPSVSFSDI